VFGQLRNLMDLCVVAAVISKEGLIERAGCDLSLLTRADSDLVLASLHPPRTVDTQCSFTKRGREYLITASGGVQIDSWQVAGRWQLGTEIDHLRGNARVTSGNWWKN
jgi:hypothetical protein